MALVAALVGCGPTPSSSASGGSPGSPGPGLTTPGPSAVETPPASTAPSVAPVAVPPDLTAQPLVWFAPLPPLSTGPGRPYIGSEDFMELFEPAAPWTRAAERVHVFKLYGEWVAYAATDAQLRTVVADLARRGLVLAVEMGPLTPPPECGHGVESFAGIDEGRLISRRIREAGGVLQVVALDEPWYFAHVYDGPNACHWPVARVAESVATFARQMREMWPDVVIGDTEPMPAPVDAAGLAEWLDAYRAAAGAPFAFLHLDVDWSRAAWPALGMAVEAAGEARGVPIGMIYNGGSASTDAQWLSVAGRRILAYEDDAAATPEHVLFQSWMDKPDFTLPEDEATSFSALINRYFDDRASLAQPPGGPPNLALGRTATASTSLPDARAAKAVDGDADTIWSAGAGPPAWIEIELGRGTEVAEVRLTVSQYPDGVTRHRVLCLAASGSTRIGIVEGSTVDLDRLTIRLDAPRTCRAIRVETLASPSWVAWREIEVFGPG